MRPGHNARKCYLPVCLCSLLGQMASEGDTDAPPPAIPDKARFHLFLLAGQSNMAGRGVGLQPVDTTPHPRVLVLNREGEWVHAADPLHYDKPEAGVGPGRSFALALAAKREDITIGLIPAACGGSPIRTWQPGEKHDQTDSFPYDDALARSRRAMQAGTLKGILWHQGEGDCHPDAAAIYEQELTRLIARLRKDLDAPGVPFIIGQLGQFAGKPWSDAHRHVDAAHRAVAAADPHAAFVSSDRLTSLPDNLHFDAASQREFGKRYAAAYLSLKADTAG